MNSDPTTMLDPLDDIGACVDGLCTIPASSAPRPQSLSANPSVANKETNGQMRDVKTTSPLQSETE